MIVGVPGEPPGPWRLKILGSLGFTKHPPTPPHTHILIYPHGVAEGGLFFAVLKWQVIMSASDDFKPGTASYCCF